MKRSTLSTFHNLNVLKVEESKDAEFFPKGVDLICLSDQQWDTFNQATPQRLSNFLQNRRVFFIEEPVVEFGASWWFEINQRESNVWVVVPHLPSWVSNELITAMRQSLVDELFRDYAIANPILWYKTPTALTFTSHIHPSMVVYDRVDKPSRFQDSSPALAALEQQLLQRADVVFNREQAGVEAKHGFVLRTKSLGAHETQLEALKAQPTAGM